MVSGYDSPRTELCLRKTSGLVAVARTHGEGGALHLGSWREVGECSWAATLRMDEGDRPTGHVRGRLVL